MQTASFSSPLICTPALSTKEKARSGSMDTDSAPVCHRKRKGGGEEVGGPPPPPGFKGNILLELQGSWGRPMGQGPCDPVLTSL